MITVHSSGEEWIEQVIEQPITLLKGQTFDLPGSNSIRPMTPEEEAAYPAKRDRWLRGLDLSPEDWPLGDPRMKEKGWYEKAHKEERIKKKP